MTAFFFSLMAFIILLIPLVVFHELGHFLFAKLFKVKAEVFSVGFGPVIWSKNLGETNFRISAIPLGGYVKLLGEDRHAPLKPEEKERSLHYQDPWKRFLIVFGGPLFNFILAFFIFMAILMIGEPHMASVVGRVVQGSPAEQAGFRNGDLIVAVNGKSVSQFEEVALLLNENPNQKMTFSIVHAQVPSSKAVDIPIVLSAQEGLSVYGESRLVGEVPGLFFMQRSTQLGVSDPSSQAGKLGLKTTDRIASLNQRQVQSWEDLETLYSEIKPREKFQLEILQGSEKKVFELQRNTSQSLEKEWGFYSAELFIEKVLPGSPAEKGGLEKGDRLLAIGKENVLSFVDLKKAVQNLGEKEGKVPVRWMRAGKTFSKDIIPTATETRDPVLKKYIQYTIGIMPMLELVEPKMVFERVWNPIRLVPMAAQRMMSFIWRNVVALKKMIAGDVSMGSIGGPLMIGKIAGESLSRGLITFLMNMAIFSIGLGVLNILPIPVLDGGHLLLLGIEILRGKPLTLRQMEMVQGLGLILILILMGIAFHNDISRFFYS